MHIEPEAGHKWLARLVGEWEFESECVMGPDLPPERFKGRESMRMLGEVWLLGEGEGEMPGGEIGRTIITLGYDTAKKRFVGSFIGSMMTNLWIYDGELDEATNTLSLDAEGPNFSGDGTMAKFRDVVELKSEDHRILRSSVLGADGAWTEFMVAHYRRVKG